MFRRRIQRRRIAVVDDNMVFVQFVSDDNATV